MLFNSFTFLVFFIIVFIIYWFPLRNKTKLQNVFILLASYVFYAWWDWHFLGLIILSTLVDYFIGNQLVKFENSNTRKGLLSISIIFNLGLLCYFKYANFFIENWIIAWESVGITSNVTSLNIILPVGISFYTFQTMSYTIDIYRNKLKPSTSLVNFAAFVAFFPQLVAGPIERASHLLPQFSIKRIFDYKYATSGLYLIVWGLFKKVVIADTCATYVNTIFDNYENMNALSLLLGAVYFAFQIYGDFSGYSDMAIGLSRVLGFDLKQNFNKPYFSRNIAEFWRRWHISLSTWFRDYLYIPLGGSKVSNILKIRNVFAIFLVSGFWHGANWTFIFWGLLNAFYFLPSLLLNRNRKYLDTVTLSFSKSGLQSLYQMLITFLLVTLAWVFFRANTLKDAFNYLKRLFLNRDFSFQYLAIERYNFEAILLLLFFILVEWLSRNNIHPFVGKYRKVFMSLILILIIILGVFSEHSSFIYFQF
ncbi:MBOAT family O-acyltransferase [Lacinutrix venerupis]|uniref:Membrane-bound O-acyltransferase family protein n=1 Tax=Lacinutrix venerupis TaxID=1486034 RepID=A0AAC9LNA6_9FLAO|nr:MBOAT family O-acyltransferase [Lacinutrix venerupis]APY00723.1 membrane-bound O-acyltransferase family protein [Lacinutrix venerupis]